MANSFDEVSRMIIKLIKDATRYCVPRIGQVSKITDPEGRGRILVHIPSLGWDTDANGAWCFPKDKNAIVTPAKGKWVLVEFIDGSMDFPVYSGMATQMKDMLPENYEDDNTQIVFESNNQGVIIKALESAKELLVEAVTKAILKGGGLSIELTSSGIVLKSGDGSTWKPSILPACIFSGAPHGGPTAGIVKISGG